MVHPSSAIDPSNYASLTLTHVQYDPSDLLANILALVTLSPFFLLCAYASVILYRRELTFVNALLGQLLCEGFNWLLKRLIRQPRPIYLLGTGYGMPSSHSQFVGFFAVFFLSHFYLNHPPLVKPRTLINTIRRLEHAIAMVLIVLLTLLTCYSRYHLSYHTPLQIYVGFAVGTMFGAVYYYLTECLFRRPLPLPSPLAVSSDLSPLALRANCLLSPATSAPNPLLTLRRRRNAQPPSTSSTKDEPTAAANPRRRSLTLSDIFIPQLYPAPPLRQIILDHPIAVALRLRDSWTVWKDGGIEGEYARWRSKWEKRRKPWRQAQDEDSDQHDPSFATASSGLQLLHDAGQGDSDLHNHAVYRYQNMILALQQADKCIPNVTAFCVGCVISITTRGAVGRLPILTTGYSRELVGNTHAEQCALDKLNSLYQATDPTIQPLAELSLDLYTTMEPCSERLSGNLPCVERILAFNQSGNVYLLPTNLLPWRVESNDTAPEQVAIRLKITRVFQGVAEPQDFVLCHGQRTLREQGIHVSTVRPIPNHGDDLLGDDWLEKECLRIAKKSHPDEPEPNTAAVAKWRDTVDDEVVELL